MKVIQRLARQHTIWNDHILQWKDSGLSQAGYCRQYNLDQNSFSYHKLKQLKLDKSFHDKPRGFISLPLPQASPINEPLTLHLNNGMKLSGIDLDNISVIEQLAKVLS
jgi:hypothetical protein